MAAFPIHSNFQGDFVLVLVSVDDTDTMDQVAEKCAYHSVNKRVPPPPANKVLRVRRHEDQMLFPRTMKINESKLRATETVDIVFLDE